MPCILNPEDPRLGRFRDLARMSRRRFVGGGSAALAALLSSNKARARLAGGGAFSGADYSILRSWGIFNVKDPTFGAVGDTVQVGDAAITTTSGVTATTSQIPGGFTSSHIGRVFSVAGGGTGGV